MSLAISVEHLSKRYQIGLAQAARNSFRDALTFSVKNLGRRVRRSVTAQPGGTAPPGEFWALKDVSFSVEAGQRVGIIGRNGAGKSTLLKLISRITEPTSGRITIEGRVASLLEVGTGFHPELTGRENIYLNGAILGMTRFEIRRKFDEIVAFSEVEKFLDTPVKRYSSGMYVRLAFSVAAHLEPEILIVDEVLAVGDAQFQKKCLGKMEDVGNQGRTILFVSHNLGAISSFCTHGVLLHHGEALYEGDAPSTIAKYIEFGRQADFEKVWAFEEAPGDSVIKMHAVRIISEGEARNEVGIGQDILIEIEYWNRKPGVKVTSSIHLIDKMGVGVLASANMSSAALNDDGWYGRPHPEGLYKTRCKIPGNFLNEGTYSVNAIVLTDVTQVHARVDDVVSFTVHDTGEMRKEYSGYWYGVVRPKLEWQTELAEPAAGASR